VAIESEYVELMVETYFSPPKSGHRGGIRVRPLPGQEYGPEHNVECDKQFRSAYPLGSHFSMTVKVTDREGGKPFLYCHFSREPTLISPPRS